MLRPLALSTCLTALLLSLHLSTPAHAEENDAAAPLTAASQSAETLQPSAAEPRSTRRARKSAQSDTETKELLAMIPDHHPMRDELRQIVLVGPPAGFSARQWLELSMKVNFRTAVTRGNSSYEND